VATTAKMSRSMKRIWLMEKLRKALHRSRSASVSDRRIAEAARVSTPPRCAARHAGEKCYDNGDGRVGALRVVCRRPTARRNVHE
jgi:hypothetical protein